LKVLYRGCEMPPISANLRLTIWIITGLGSLALALLVVVLDKDIRYFITRRGPKPKKPKPLIIWILFWAAAIIVILGTAIASSAPDKSLPTSIAVASPKFPHAGNGEILIIIARYAGELSEYKVFPERYVRDSLRRHSIQLTQKGYKIRVEEWDQEITVSRDARMLGEEYGATLVVWGEFDDLGGIHTFVEVLSDLPAIEQQQVGEWLSFRPILPDRQDVDLTRECIISGNPAQADYLVMLSLGIISLSQSDFGNANTLFSEAISVIPSGECTFNQYLAYYWRGISNNSQEQYLDAVSDFNNAETLGLSTAELFGARGVARFIVGDTVGALEDLGKSSDLIGNDDPKRQSVATGNLGLIYEFMGEIDKALDLYEKALSLDKSLSDEYGMAMDYGWMGNLSYRKSDFDTAIRYYRLALDKYRAIDNKKGEAAMIGNIGTVYESKGNLSEAEDAYSEAMNLNMSIGYKQGIALDYLYLGNLAYDTANYQLALENYQNSVSICTEIDYRLCIAVITGNIGLVNIKLNEIDNALDNFSTALYIHEAIGYQFGVAKQQIYLGTVYQMTGDYAKARISYEESLRLYESIKSPKGQADCFLGLGVLDIKENKLEDARMNLNKALEIYSDLGYVQEANIVYNTLNQLGH